MEKKSDDSIRAALAQDDPAAIEWIWDRYAADLLVMLQARLGSRHDGEDVLQAVFVRIASKHRQLAKARCLDAYIFRLARNEVASYAKRRKRDRTLPDPWLIACDGDQEQKDRAEQTEAALAQLPPEQREVIVLKLYREKTFAEIAQLLDIPQNTAASRYRYGMEKLSKILRDFES